MSRPRKPKPPIALTEAPPAVTIELFPSYAEARASSDGLGPIVSTLLGVPELCSREQEAWAVERGREVAALRKAIKDRQEKFLKPLREIEDTIRSFDVVTISPDLAAKLDCNVHVRALDLLEICSKHLAGLVGEYRETAAKAQAALLPQATSEEERTEALAALQPKISGYVETVTWTWELTEWAMPKAELRDDGKVALVFGPATVPPSYFVLDVARLDRETSSQKGAFAVPGVMVRCESGGHFRS